MKTKSKQAGFTIIELMIATVVLATILLLVTGMMIGIGRLFTKGVNQSRTQANVRNITDELAQRLQYNNTDVTGGTGMDSNTRYYCVGTTRYTYVIGQKIGDVIGAQTLRHVLWRDTPTGGCVRPTAGFMYLANPNPSGQGTEMIAPNSRLTAMCINCASGALTSPYTIQVGVAYGDADLLTSTNNINASCISQAGSQFCATAALTTVVVQRYTKS